VKLPDELPQTPYEVVAFRVHHFHPPDDEDVDGSILLEFGARLPDTDVELAIPLEMSPETVIGLIDELLHQYRCLEHGLPDEDEEPGAE
jgi:hypothetical protein